MSEQEDILVQFDERPNTRKAEKQALMRRVLDVHRDAGPSWGYSPYDNCYIEMEHYCAACSRGGYLIEWPCPTVRALADALGVEP